MLSSTWLPTIPEQIMIYPFRLCRVCDGMREWNEDRQAVSELSCTALALQCKRACSVYDIVRDQPHTEYERT